MRSSLPRLVGVVIWLLSSLCPLAVRAQGDALTPRVYVPLITSSASTTVAPAVPGALEQQVVDLTNVRRAAVGCPPLTVSPQLAAAAHAHSLDMAANSFMDHTGSDGSSPWARIARSGYVYSMAAENIAAGYETPESVVAAWVSSVDHRENMLNCALVEIGVGHASGGAMRHYWTQDFGRPGGQL